MRDELYFCLYFTESEHDFIMEELEDLCKNHNLELLYYRKLKDGHLPMYREVKIKGDIGYVKGYISENKLEENLRPNPYRLKDMDELPDGLTKFDLDLE